MERRGWVPGSIGGRIDQLSKCPYVRGKGERRDKNDAESVTSLLVMIGKSSFIRIIGMNTIF